MTGVVYCNQLHHYARASMLAYRRRAVGSGRRSRACCNGSSPGIIPGGLGSTPSAGDVLCGSGSRSGLTVTARGS